MHSPRAPASDDLAATLLVAAASLACLIHDPAATASNAKTTVALAVAALAVGVRAQRILHEMRSIPGLAAWIAFTGWSAVTVTWGTAAGWLDLAPWVASCGVALAAASFESSRARRIASDTALVVGTVSSAAAVYEHASGARGILVHGGQGNGNWLGLLLAVALPLGVPRVRSAWRAGDRLAPALAVMLLLQIAALWMSESRTALIALGVASVAALAARRAGRASRLVATLATGALSLSMLGAAPAEPPVDAPVATSWTAAWHGRVWIWGASLEAALAHPIMGNGLGSFGHAYLRAQADRLAGLPPWRASRVFENATTAHQDWIQAWCDSGTVALVLLVASFVLTLRDQRVSRWTAGLTSTLSLAICAAADSPLRQPAVVLLWGLVIAGTTGKPAGGLVGPACFAAVLAGCSALLGPSTAHWFARRWETFAQDAEPAERIALLSRAVRLAPSSGEAWLDLGLARQELGDCEGAVEALDRSTRLLANVGTYVAMGNALIDCGRVEQAVDTYERAIALHPGGFRARANLVEALRRLGRYEQARRELQVAKTIYPGHPKIRELGDRVERAAADGSP